MKEGDEMRLFSKEKKSYIKINNIIYKKLLIFLIIAVSIPSVGICALSIKHSSDNIIEQASRANASILMEKEATLNQKVTDIDNYISLLISNKDIWNLVMLDQITDSYNDQAIMLKILDVLKGRLDYKDWIVSAYLFDSKHDFVLSDAKYTKEDFYDRDVLNLKFDSSRFIDVRQITMRAQRANKKVVSYIRKFKVFTSDNYMYFVINLDYNKFFDVLETDNSKSPISTLIIDKNYSTAYLKSNTLVKLEDRDLMDIWNGSDNFEKEINGKNYFICKKYSPLLNWSLVYMQPYENLVRTADLLRDLIVYSSLAIMVLSFIMAYIFSVFLYKPLANIMIDVLKYTGLETVGKQNGRNVNEYKIIDGVVKKLFTENNELHSKYELTFPYFRYHFVNDLLTSSNFDTGKFKSLLEHLGIYFIFPKFISVIIDFENRQFDNEIGNRLEDLLDDNKEDLIYILSKIDNSRVLVLINTRFDPEMINLIMLKIKNNFKQLEMDLTIAIGQTYDEIEKICESYLEALHQIDNKFFTGKNEIIIHNGVKQENKMFFYDRRLEEEMLNYIKAQNVEKALISLKKLTNELLSNTSSMEYVKYVCFNIINHIVCGLEDIGVDLTNTEISNIYIFEKIEKLDTFIDLQLFFKVFIEKSVLLLNNLKEKQHTILVNKILDFIKNNYQHDLSLEDISEKVFLSPSYINGIFKAETGMTIFDYLTKRRMEVARNLLLKQNMKIQDIAVNIGYNNIQSFLRTFKRYFQLTPIEYRRKYTIIEGNTSIHNNSLAE